MMKSTPTPWKYQFSQKDVYHIDLPDREGGEIATTWTDNAEGNAALIVKCVNHHADLVEALEILLHEIMPLHLDISRSVIEQVRRVLAKIKGEAP